MNLAGKNIVITGAASGIGRAMTRRFKAEGAANIVITDVNAEGLAAVAEETGAIAQAANLGEEQAVLDFIGFAETELGQIDLLCNNAGISVSGGPEVETSDWQAIWNINVMAHVWATRAALLPCSCEEKAIYCTPHPLRDSSAKLVPPPTRSLSMRRLPMPNGLRSLMAIKV